MRPAFVGRPIDDPLPEQDAALQLAERPRGCDGRNSNEPDYGIDVGSDLPL
jgi:hypothetical protein